VDGRPGKNYWQNHGRYNIVITASPPDRIIEGSEDITYFNNSPDTLHELAIKLILNSHKPNAPRASAVPMSYLTSGIHIDECKINNQSIDVSNDSLIFTNLYLKLDKPLSTNDSVQLHFKWHYELSLIPSREGLNGKSATDYFLAYFYPRVAVYDDYSGWDWMEFVEEKEFYSDFNDYTVTLNVPKNFIVWGTGTLQHPENILQAPYLDRYYKSFISDSVIHIVSASDWQSKNVTFQNAVNSWQFKADNICDMTFGISDKYLWDGCSVVVDNKSKRRVSVQSVYSSAAKSYSIRTNDIPWQRLTRC
jgi:hypothetical protein